MVSSTKKRKELRPTNRTLLDFFSSPDVMKRARASQRVSSSVRRTNSNVTSREVIVIDSDSDDSVHGKESGKGSVSLNPRTGASENSRSLDSTTSTSARSEDKDAFGAPSELLLPINSWVSASSDRPRARRHSPIACKPDHSESMFGISAPLLEQTCVRSQTDFVSHGNVSTVASFNDATIEFPVEEWAVGDDELADLETSENGAEIKEEPFNEQSFCPVCGIGLTGILVLDAQTHVNQCLDTTLQSDDTVIQECTLTTASVESCVTSNNVGPSTLVRRQGDDLYTVLMNAYKENVIWAEADAIADRDVRPTRGNRRKAPFYKILQGMPIAVDAFCYGTIPGVTAYFLTHAHSDHYTNLGSKWSSGPIYCSEETANLIIHMLAVDPRWIHPLPLDTPTTIPNTGGVSVTLIEANHCPGSCLFFFEGHQTIDAGDDTFKSPFLGPSTVFRYLHCGDFRASPRHVLHPAVKGKHIDHIYLDTTYLDPKYMFSPQPLVISACAELARRLVMGGVGDNPNAHINRNSTVDPWIKSSTFAETVGQQMLQRILVIVGTYSIGKERMVKAIAQALKTKIYCDPRKTAILLCQADKELHALLTADPTEANVHILPLGTVSVDNLRSYLQRFKGTFSRIIGFRPTGWSYSLPSDIGLNTPIQSIISRGQSRHLSYTDLQPSQRSSHNIWIYGVPYSEHSSFFELTCFAMSCDWGRMIPTVNIGSPTSRAKMTKWLKRWELEKKYAKSSFIQPRTADYW